MADPVIDAKGLYHIYREIELETVALRGVDLALYPGTWNSVMGPSGSGKSTLLHVMAGLIEPSGGAVMIDGQDLTRLPPPERARRRRSRIGVVLQRDNLHPLLDVAENVALPLRIDGHRSEQIRDTVSDRLEMVGLADRRDHLARELSGGEEQRAAIAVALAPRPQVLFADEPTGELDERTALSVLDLIGSVRASAGTAVMTVTHNPSVTARADRRVVMRDGVVIEDA